MEKARPKLWPIAIAVGAFIPAFALCVGVLLYRNQGNITDEIWQILFVTLFTILPFWQFARKPAATPQAADEDAPRQK